MRRVLGLGLLVLFAYLVVWGASWLAGDKSTVLFGVSEGGASFASYPGVLFGGLPPDPGLESYFPFLGATLGVVGLVALLVVRLRRT
jgi:hypothetical protein